MMGQVMLATVVMAAFVTQVRADERWQAVSTTASSITGNVTFAPDKITFTNKKSLPLADGRKLAAFISNGRAVDAMLYKVTVPTDLLLVHGNHLCDGKPITWVVVWNPPEEGSEVASRSMAPFSGQNVPASDDSPTSCGTFNYEVRTKK
jgi:hypothetical protein